MVGGSVAVPNIKNGKILRKCNLDVMVVTVAKEQTWSCLETTDSFDCLK